MLNPRNYFSESQQSLATLLLLAALNGCVSTGSLNMYTPVGRSLPAPRIDLLVIAGTDDRPYSVSSGSGLLAYIPLIPYGHQVFPIGSSFTAPADRARPGGFEQDLVDAVVKDLRAAGIAGTVSLKDRRLPFEADRPAFALQLFLTEGICNRYLTAYGLSVAGVLLWVVGAPLSYGSVDVAFSAELKDPKGKRLGEKLFAGKVDVTEWLYKPFPGSCLGKLPDLYAQISPELRSFVANSLTYGDTAH